MKFCKSDEKQLRMHFIGLSCPVKKLPGNTSIVTLGRVCREGKLLKDFEHKYYLKLY